jgi:Family of unknown function (DUF6356)
MRKTSKPFSAAARRIDNMFRRFTDHPASVNETYFQHMGQAFGFGSHMLVGALACFVHGLFPWLCLKRGSDTIRTLHHRMVTHRVVRPDASGRTSAVAAGD